MQALRGRFGRGGRMAVVLVAMLAIGVGLAAWLRPARAGGAAAQAVPPNGVGINTYIPNASVSMESEWSNDHPFKCTLNFTTVADYTAFIGSYTGAVATYIEGPLNANSTMFTSTFDLISTECQPTPRSVTLTFAAKCPHNLKHFQHPAAPDGTGRIIVITMAVGANGVFTAKPVADARTSLEIWQ